MPKIIPTENELNKIKEMIKDNCSFAYMSEQLCMSDKTIQRIIKDYGIDMSTYNKHEAHGKRIRKEITEEQLDEIVSLLEQGISLRQIIKNYPVSYPTLNKRLNQRGIFVDSYKKKSIKKFTLTANDIEDIKVGLSNKEPIYKIAKRYNVNRNTFSNTLKEYNVLQYDEKEVDDNLRNLVILMHKNNLTEKEIKEITNLSKDTVISIITQENDELSIKKKYRNRVNNPVTFDTYCYFLNEYYKIIGNESLITQQDIDYVVNNILQVSYLDIIKRLGKDYDKLRHYIVLFGKKDIFNINILLSNAIYSDKIKEELSNGCFSSSEISYRYGVKYTNVSEIRKKLFPNVKTYFKTNISSSTLELKFELILESLKLAYIKEFIIQDKKYDYYIGQNIVIELQGAFWHKNTVNEDYTKRQCAIENGYIYLSFSEEKVNNNREEVIRQIRKAYLEQLKINLDN